MSYIITLLMTLVAKVLPASTVDTAISFVTKALNALAAAEAASNDKAGKLIDEAKALVARAEMLTETAGEHTASATRAAVIRGNLAALTQAPVA